MLQKFNPGKAAAPTRDKLQGPTRRGFGGSLLPDFSVKFPPNFKLAS